MKKLQYSIVIQAPREKVWDTVIGKETYPLWTAPFSPTPGVQSEARGDWAEGSKMRFIATEEGGEMGMLAEIAENRRPEFLSIRHLGFIKNGVEDTESDEVKAWLPAYENYTFVDVDGGTEFLVDLDAEEKYAEMFDKMWPAALEKLKELSEM